MKLIDKMKQIAKKHIDPIGIIVAPMTLALGLGIGYGLDYTQKANQHFFEGQVISELGSVENRNYVLEAKAQNGSLAYFGMKYGYRENNDDFYVPKALALQQAIEKGSHIKILKPFSNPKRSLYTKGVSPDEIGIVFPKRDTKKLNNLEERR